MLVTCLSVSGTNYKTEDHVFNLDDLNEPKKLG